MRVVVTSVVVIGELFITFKRYMRVVYRVVTFHRRCFAYSSA